MTGIENVKGGDGNDLIYGDGVANYLFGEDGNDKLYGRDGNDWLYGEIGNDKLFGGVGNDKLFGGDENDILKGNNGNDTLTGGLGNDQLTGGGGNDIFQINTGIGKDVIKDYSSRRDSIQLLGGLTESDLTIFQAQDDARIKYGNDLMAIVRDTLFSDLTFI